jgi:hypothetical protein
MKKKGVSFIWIAFVIILGIGIGTKAFESDKSDIPSNNATDKSDIVASNGLPLLTKESLREQMDFNFKETTWYPLITSYLVLNEERTIKIYLKSKKTDVKNDQAKSIAGAVAGLTYLEGRTNYFIYKVVDNQNNLIYTFDVVDQNSEDLMKILKKIIEQSDGVIQKIEARDTNWDGMNVIVSDSWYYAEDFEKERFVESYGGQISEVILKYMYVIGKDDVKIYFVDEYGKEVVAPKLLGGYKIKE